MSHEEREPFYPYKYLGAFPANTRPMLALVSRARGMDFASLIREYVARGLSADIARLGLHLKEEPK